MFWDIVSHIEECQMVKFMSIDKKRLLYFIQKNAKYWVGLGGVLLGMVELLPAQPKLVVGIVVDQMRNEYVYRYWNKFSPTGGFKKLIREGAYFSNTHYTYFPTYTAPGHASVYTGTTPAHHGIVANEWYDVRLRRMIYCVADTAVMSVGCYNEAGKMSPRHLQSTTITDELKLITSGKSKVFGIAMKDRGAILPAGHMPDAAYWFDGASGNFVTSSYYMTHLPVWVEKFNGEKHAMRYLQQEWRPLLPIEQYTESVSDSNAYERSINGKNPVFNYDLKSLALNGGPGIIRYTPWGNTLTLDFAKSLIENEHLGEDEIPDFLAISFSSTDYIGHLYGPRSVEMEDVYLRLDQDLGNFLAYLEKKFGKNNVLLFLTADHGCAENPVFNREHHLPGRNVTLESYFDSLNHFLRKKASSYPYVQPGGILKHPHSLSYVSEVPPVPPVLNISNQQIYFHPQWAAWKDLLYEWCNDFFYSISYVKALYRKEELKYLGQDRTTEAVRMLANGCHATLSGDLFIHTFPGDMEYDEKGTTHGSVYRYDTHVPLIFWGYQIPAIGNVSSFKAISDIAATLAVLLRTGFPSASTGEPIREICK